MKIISKFRDYYDGVQSLGIDTRVVYHRRTAMVDVPEEGRFAKVFDSFIEYARCMSMRSKRAIRHSNVYIPNVLIGFCGAIYECYVVVEYSDTNTLAHQFFHSKEELIDYLQSRSEELKVDDLQYYIHETHLRRKKLTWRDSIPELHRPDRKSSFDDLFHALQEPVFLYPAYIYDPEFVKTLSSRVYPRFEGKDIIVNPSLRELQFQKVKDAFQCYQEIDQYINGVLGSKEYITDSRTNIEKIRSHGFDEKSGFRKRKDT